MNSMTKILSLALGSILFLCVSISSLVREHEKNITNPTFANYPVRKIDSLTYSSHIINLQDSFGINKFIIPKYKLQCLIALSFYPSLKNIHIDFAHSSINTTMQCKPTINSLIKNSNNKEYVITINNNESFEGVLLKNVPFNAQIGVISHELSHIIDYEKKNTLGVINRGLDYLNDETKKEYEQYIDSLTISIGLGWQLYDWADYVLNKSKATQEYKDFKRKIYLTPELILNQIKKNPIYKNCLIP